MLDLPPILLPSQPTNPTTQKPIYKSTFTTYTPNPTPTSTLKPTYMKIPPNTHQKSTVKHKANYTNALPTPNRNPKPNPQGYSPKA